MKKNILAAVSLEGTEVSIFAVKPSKLFTRTTDQLLIITQTKITKTKYYVCTYICLNVRNE